MMSSYLEELEHEPFDVCEFVERLTWRTNNEAETDFDAELLKVKDFIKIEFRRLIFNNIP